MSDQTANVDVAVIGAGGATGQALICELVQRGVRVRALVHREAQRALFPDVQEVCEIELDDHASLVAGLSKSKVAHYIPPVFNADEERFGANVIAAAIAANISKLVYHSVLHAPTPAMPHHLRKSRVEYALRESALAWTVVQPAMYSQTPLAFLSADRTSLSPGFNVDRPFTPIAMQDLSEAVANVLLEDSHAFATYELAGSERLTFTDMAAAIAQIIGKPVQAHAQDAQVVQQQAEGRGFNASAARELRLMMDHYDQHGLVGNGNVLRMLLRREPTQFKDAVAPALSRSVVGDA